MLVGAAAARGEGLAVEAVQQATSDDCVCTASQTAGFDHARLHDSTGERCVELAGKIACHTCYHGRALVFDDDTVLKRRGTEAERGTLPREPHGGGTEPMANDTIARPSEDPALHQSERVRVLESLTRVILCSRLREHDRTTAIVSA